MYGPQGSQVPSDFVVEFSKVISSAIATDPDTGEALGVTYAVTGVAGLDLSGDEPEILLDDDAGEGDDAADIFGALGVVARPLPPEVQQGRSKHAEVVCLRTADGLIPIAARDNRLVMGGNAPHEGTVALLGYGGGFHSIEPVDGDPANGSLHTIYCPYDFDSEGVAQKAHVITLDPTSGNESITLVHAEGMALFMLKDSKNTILMKNKAGDATLRLDDDGITMTATKIVCSGGVIVGEPLTAVPLLAGVASPASTKFFVSP